MIKDLVEALYPLHRTLVSEGTDQALEIIGQNMPQEANYNWEVFTPGEPAWTWRVPERYVVHEAYLETEEGERIVDFHDSPLHLVSYSLPVDTTLTWEELEPHLQYAPHRPWAIPWVYRYYERSWGFCLSKDQFDQLPRDRRYRAVIRSEFVTRPEEGLRVGVGTLSPEDHRDSNGEMMLMAHVCHPHQANDDATGVAVLVEVARRLARNPLPAGSLSIRFLFCPETIGSICYLSHHEDLIPQIKGGLFCEMPGNRNSIALQHTRQDDHLLDRVARWVLYHRGVKFREGAFRDIIGNDEMVLNGPGVNVPTISISRWPYDEYHTSDDNPDIVHEDMLQETADVIEELVRVYATNYVPLRTFRGPVFLSGYGLWVDPQTNGPLNRAIEQIMLRFEGDRTVFDIADELQLDYWDVHKYVKGFQSNGLINALPIPSEAEAR